MNKDSNHKPPTHKLPKCKSEFEPYEDLEEQIYKAINEVKGQHIIWNIIIDKMTQSPDKEFFEKLFETMFEPNLTNPNGKEILKKTLISI